MTPKATMLKFTFAIFCTKALDFYTISAVFELFLCLKAVSCCRSSLLEISNGPVELELLFDQRLTQALSYFLGEALLCLNILNIFLVGPPPLSRCAPLTVLTLSNLQGGGPFPIPPPTDPLCLSLNLTFTHSTEVSPHISPLCQVFQVSGQYFFLYLGKLCEELRKLLRKSYCLSATCYAMKTELLNT